MSGEARFRPAQLADAAPIAALLAQLGYPGAEDFIARRLSQLLTHPDAALVVAEIDGRLAAVMSVHFIPQLGLAGDFARLAYLCVDESMRGRGIGAALERYCERLARARGCDRIELHSHSRRVDAHRFYARQGYRESPKYLVKLLSEPAH